MPCFTRITVQLKDEAAIKAACKTLGIHKSNIRKLPNGFEVDLTNSRHSEAKFKTEYGMVLATNAARQQYGYKAHIYRTIENTKPTLNIRLNK